MRRSGLDVIAHIARAEERRARAALGVARRNEARCRDAVPPPTPPIDTGIRSRAELDRALLLSSLGEAERREALDLVDQAVIDVAAAQSLFAARATEHRALERLVGRRQREARRDQARRAGKDLDEVGVSMWRRVHVDD